MNVKRPMLSWPVSTASGSILGARSVNHDRVLATPDALIVIDGAGDSRDAGITATAGLAGAVVGLTKAAQTQYPSALTIVEEAANAVSNLGPSGSSATITALQLIASGGPTAHLAWLGDSPGYLLRDGVLRQLTRPHNRAQDMAERKLLTYDEAMVSPMSTVLTRGIGALDGAPESLSVTLADGDRLLVGTDGVLAVPPVRLAWALSQGDDARAAVDAVLEAAIDQRVSDNVGVAALVVGAAPWSASGIFVSPDPREQVPPQTSDLIFEEPKSAHDDARGRGPRRGMFERRRRPRAEGPPTGPLPG